MSQKKFLNINEVCELTTLSRATIYRKIATNHFPVPIHLTERTSRWLETDIEEWINSAILCSRV